MRQILFVIPGLNIPIFGYGVMLAAALLVCTWLAARTAKKNGGDEEAVYDLGVWILIGGIFGARLFYFLQYFKKFDHWWEFFLIWRGGLVVYGAALGAFLAFWIFATRRGIGLLWMLDVCAPSLALGMAFGRIGCLLNGCCYGDYCEAPWALTFPAQSEPSKRLIEIGVQNAFGFAAGPIDDREDGRRIWYVDPRSDAAKKGLAPGDEIVEVDGNKTPTSGGVARGLFEAAHPKDKQPLASLHLVVNHLGDTKTLAVDPAPSLPIHPTQLYMSFGAFLLFLLLSAFYPLRQRDGEVIALFVVCYSVGRFLVEYVRFDEAPLSDGLTISQNVSVGFLVVGLLLTLYVKTRSLPAAAPLATA